MTLQNAQLITYSYETIVAVFADIVILHMQIPVGFRPISQLDKLFGQIS